MERIDHQLRGASLVLCWTKFTRHLFLGKWTSDPFPLLLACLHHSAYLRVLLLRREHLTNGRCQVPFLPVPAECFPDTDGHEDSDSSRAACILCQLKPSRPSLYSCLGFWAFIYRVISPVQTHHLILHLPLSPPKTRAPLWGGRVWGLEAAAATEQWSSLR